MRIFILKAVIFCVIGLGIFLALDYGVDYFYTESAEIKYGELVNPLVKANLVIMGTSHAEAGINPRYLEGDGLNVYNFSFSGSNPVYYRRWYKDFFRAYYPKPEIVVFSVDWFLFDDTWLWRKFEHDSEYLPARVFFGSFLVPGTSYKRLLQNRFATLKSHISVVNLFLSKQKVEGYYKGHYSYTIPTTDKPVSRPNKIEQVRAFLDLIDMMRRDNIKIIFAHLPEYTPETQINDANIRWLRHMATRRDIPFLDYNGELASAINRNKDYFLDWGHLNERGSEHFSRQFNHDLREVLHPQ